MSNKKITPPQFVTGLVASKGRTQDSVLLLSHPYINISVMDGLMTILRLKSAHSLSSATSRPVMENIALWLKKCLLMQLTTRKFVLQSLMATG